MRHRLAVTWSAILMASGLLGCAGRATDGSRAHGGSEAQGGAIGAGVAGSLGGGGVGVGSVGGGGSVGGASVGGGGVGGHGGEAGVELNENGGFGGRGSTDLKLLSASAWDVTVIARSTGDVTAPPNTFALTLAVLDENGPLTGILSGKGGGSTLGLTRESGAQARLAASGVRLSLSGSHTGLTLNTLTLTAFDDDADGVADRLAGNGDGALVESCGDCFFSTPVSLALSGKPDQTAPTLALPGVLNPVDRLSVSTSEALRSSTLSVAGSVAAPLYPDALTPPLTFTTSAVLPFGGAWKIAGAGLDFAWLPLDLSSANVATIADPGIFAQDGFETKPNADLSAGVEWVDASSGLPIPHGNRAMLLPPGSVATFHLQRAAANSTLSVRVRALGTSNTNVAWFQLDAALIGSAERIENFSTIDVGSVPTSHPSWTRASDAKIAQYALKYPNIDLAVRIIAQECSGGPCPELGALLVDDLMIE